MIIEAYGIERTCQRAGSAAIPSREMTTGQARRYQILGPLQVLDDGVALDVGPAKQRSLLLMLLLRAGQVVPTDVLVDQLWSGGPPPSAVTTLHGYVAGLRRALGAHTIRTRSPGYLIDIGPGELDLEIFTTHQTAGRAALASNDFSSAAAALRAALDLWRGPALVDLGGDLFARPDVVRLEEARLAAVNWWALAELALGNHAEIVAELESAVAGAPFREDLRARLATSLYRCGRQVEALQTISAARALLSDELGLDPGPELAELETQILRHDPVIAAPGVDPARPVTVVAARPGPVGMTGRDREINELLADLTAAIAGDGRMVLLGGEPGIGKTRLAEEVARAAVEREVAVVWGRCDESPGAPAFWPWMQVVDALVTTYGEESARRAIGSDAASLGLVAPDVHALTGVEPEAPSPDPEAARFLTCAAATRMIDRLASQRPLVIVIDDLQWADVASLELLSAVARSVRGRSVLLVVTVRATELAGPAVVETMAALARVPGRRHDLVGLPEHAVTELLDRGGIEADADLALELHRRTHGNPFFLNELVRWMRGSGERLGQQVPAAVGDVVRDRVRRLGEPAAEVLACAAILGQHLEADLLAGVTGLSPDKLLDCLAPSVTAGLLVTNGEAGRWRFAHGLVRDAIEADLDLGQRTELHLRAARAFGAIHGEHDGPHLSELAHHLVEAIPTSSRIDAVAALLRAAGWASQHLAPEQAGLDLQRALALVADLPAGPTRDGEELQVQSRIARLLLTTEGYARIRLLDACYRIRELCLRLDTEHPFYVPALWMLSVSHMVRMEFDAAAELCVELIRLGDETANSSTSLLGHLASGSFANHKGDFLLGRAHLDAAFDLCRSGHDEPLMALVPETPLVWALSFSGWNWWAIGDSEQAERDVLAAIEYGTERGRTTYPRTFATWFAGLVAMLRQDAPTTIRRCDDGIAAASAGGFGMFIPFMQANRGWALAAQGEVELGLAEIERARDAIDLSGARMLRHVFPCLLADVHLRAGHLESAASFAREGLLAVEETGEPWLEAELYRLLALALRHSDPAEAIVMAEQSVEVATAQGSQTLVDRGRLVLADLGDR